MWVGHLQRADFDVSSVQVSGRQLEAVKSQSRVPRPLRTCHTAIVDGYIIEGHVPADVVQRLLRERPDIAGIGVPGMPIGSPGMEGPNPVDYDVYAFDDRGRLEVYAHVAAR